jgi:hypothetical protein
LVYKIYHYAIRKTLWSNCNTAPKRKDDNVTSHTAGKINYVPEKEDKMLMLLLLDIIRNLQFRSYILMLTAFITWWKR